MAGFTSAAIAAGSSLFQVGKSIIDKNDAEDAIKNFDRQELKNPFENIKISTLASEQQTDANLSNAASSIDALQRAGTRAVLAGVPSINENNILLQNEISKDLERQDRERDLRIAQGEVNIQNIRENRENAALQGLGQSLQVARQDNATGVSNLVQSGLAFNSLLNSQEEGVDETIFSNFNF